MQSLLFPISFPHITIIFCKQACTVVNARCVLYDTEKTPTCSEHLREWRSVHQVKKYNCIYFSVLCTLINALLLKLLFTIYCTVVICVHTCVVPTNHGLLYVELDKAEFNLGDDMCVWSPAALLQREGPSKASQIRFLPSVLACDLFHLWAFAEPWRNAQRQLDSAFVQSFHQGEKKVY